MILHINTFGPIPSHSSTESLSYIVYRFVASQPLIAWAYNFFFFAGSDPTVGGPGFIRTYFGRLVSHGVLLISEVLQARQGPNLTSPQPLSSKCFPINHSPIAPFSSIQDEWKMHTQSSQKVNLHHNAIINILRTPKPLYFPRATLTIPELQ